MLLLQFYKDRPYGLESEDYKWALAVWQDMAYWSHLVQVGCDDSSMESRRAHGAKLRQIAERMVCKVLEKEQPNFCSVYLHIMTCHVEVCSHDAML